MIVLRSIFKIKFMKKVSRALLLFLLCFSTSYVYSQNQKVGLFEHSSLWRIDLGMQYGIDIFHASELSVISNDPQQILYSSSNSGLSGKFIVYNNTNVESLRTSVLLGIDWNQSETPLVNEKINLQSVVFMGGFMLELSKITSLDFSIGAGWGQYNNSFSVLNQNYSYKKNGLAAKFKSSVYFSVEKYVQIGFGVDFQVYQFKDNDAIIDVIPSQLPTENRINSIKPFIALKMSI